jgi:hypothetical protein
MNQEFKKIFGVEKARFHAIPRLLKECKNPPKIIHKSSSITAHKPNYDILIQLYFIAADDSTDDDIYHHSHLAEACIQSNGTVSLTLTVRYFIYSCNNRKVQYLVGSRSSTTTSIHSPKLKPNKNF